MGENNDVLAAVVRSFHFRKSLKQFSGKLKSERELLDAGLPLFCGRSKRSGVAHPRPMLPSSKPMTDLKVVQDWQESALRCNQHWLHSARCGTVAN